MIKLVDNLRRNTETALQNLDNGIFFELDECIYQTLSWDAADSMYNCVEVATMKYISLSGIRLVKPVDVTITVNGYSGV